MNYRITYINPDNRREPKTDDYCVRCHKDFKPNAKHRMVHLVEGGLYALHREDEGKYNNEAADLLFHKIGMDCARTIGLEYTHE